MATTSEKKRITKIIVIALIVFVVLAAAGVVLGTVYSNYVANGGSERSTISFESDHYKVNNCMYTYFNYTGIYNYGAYLSMMGVDPTQPLSSQDCSYMQADENGNQGTWHQYFIQQSANEIMTYLNYAEAARAADFEYADIEKDIDSQIEVLKGKATEAGYENLQDYLDAYYASFVKESDVRDALKLQLFANKYYTKAEDDIKAELTESDYDTKLNDNPNSLKKVDFMSYSISADVAEDADEAATQVANQAAEARAKELLAAAATKEAFTEWVKADLTEKNATAETPSTEEEIKEQAESVTEGQAYSEGDDFSTWAFDANRAVGEATMLDDGNGTYTVYFLIKTPYLEEYETKNVRHILLKSEEDNETIEAKAKEILDEFKAGDKSEDAFDALAKEHNEDTASLYKNVTKGQMVEEFNDWIFNDQRKAGDTDIVKTQYGYHIMYFAGNGLKAWQAEAQSNLTSDKMTETTTKWQEDHKVDYEINAIYQIPDTIPTAAAASMASTDGVTVG